MKIRLSGTADDLEATWDAMAINLVVAIAIVYLIMAVLFESFVYPFVIMLSVPLAAAGGVLGLAAVNTYTFQPLDMLTLLGFVILVGIVVNNAILPRPSDPVPHAGRADGGRRCDHDGDQEPDSAHLHVDAHERVRHVAAGAVPRCGLRALPGASARWVIGGLAPLRRAHAVDRPAALLAVVATRQQRKRERLGTALDGPAPRGNQCGVSGSAATPLHSWGLSPKEAIALQKALAGAVVRSDRFGPRRPSGD